MYYDIKSTHRLLYLLCYADQYGGTATIRHHDISISVDLHLSATIIKSQAELTVRLDDTRFRVFFQGLNAETGDVRVWSTMYCDEYLGLLHACTWRGPEGAELPVSADHYDLVTEKIIVALDAIWRRYQLLAQKEEACA